jgi:hypothetical protein
VRGCAMRKRAVEIPLARLIIRQPGLRQAFQAPAVW